MIKILHTADIHLGAKFSSLEERSQEHRKQIEDTFKKIIERALKETNLFLISGDLFDSQKENPRLTNLVKEAFSELERKKIKTFLLPGTHDSFRDQNSIYKKIDFEKSFSYLSIFKKFEKKEIPELDLTIWGIFQKEDFLKIKEKKTKHQIALLHGSFLIPGKTDKDEFVFSKEELENLDIDYFALGHWHSLYEIPLKKNKAFYPGSPEVISFAEKKSGNIIFLEVNKEEVKILPEKIGQRHFETKEIDLTKIKNKEELKKEILGTWNENQLKNIALLISLKGFLDQEIDFDLKGLEEELKNRFFRVKFQDESHLKVDFLSKNDFSENLVIGKFVEICKEKIRKEKDEKKKKNLEKVLQIGIGLLQGKDILC